LELQRRGASEISGLKPEIANLLQPFADEERKIPEQKPRKDSAIELLGRAAVDLTRDAYEQIAFLGQSAATFLKLMFRPRQLRWPDVWTTYERAGVQALSVVGLISFLTGLIMAFQAAPPLREFGVDLFVVNLVSLAMLRELGPIMTAIVLAGRSGSAFAAEIGTMKVNEEINALTTMGLDPVRFLVAPRVLAGVLVTPVLTIYSDLVGVAGGLVVMFGRGYPAMTLWRQLVSAVEVNDVLAGLIKAFVFGGIVAGIGCLRGLQTKAGASAVGISTTRSVVTSIFYIVVVDAIFAVVYYAINF
ncbi:MAG TPA: ABC transporter permease, partial [Terrimicrobiaceae bacterium]